MNSNAAVSGGSEMFHNSHFIMGSNYSEEESKNIQQYKKEPQVFMSSSTSNVFSPGSIRSPDDSNGNQNSKKKPKPPDKKGKNNPYKKPSLPNVLVTPSSLAQKKRPVDLSRY